jgi:hypothetical protein
MLEYKFSIFLRLLMDLSIIAWLKENSVCGPVTVWKHMITDHPLRPETEGASEEFGTGSKRTDIRTVWRNRAAATAKCGIKKRKRGSQGPDLRSNQQLSTRPNAKFRTFKSSPTSFISRFAFHIQHHRLHIWHWQSPGFTGIRDDTYVYIVLDISWHPDSI